MPSLPVLALMVILPLLWAAQAADATSPPKHARQAGMGSAGDHQIESSRPGSGM